MPDLKPTMAAAVDAAIDAIESEPEGWGLPSLDSLEQTLVASLQWAAGCLYALSWRLQEAGPAATCSALGSSLSARAVEKYDALPEAVQFTIWIVLAFLCLLALVFLLPKAAGYFIGTDPLLDPVPSPGTTYSPDDDMQAESFIDVDVAPQLVAASPGSLKCISPLDGTTLGYAAPDTAISLSEKVAAARAAQHAWAATSFAARSRVLRVLRQYILTNQPTLCGLSRLDSGKTLLDANIGEILPTLEKIRWLLSEGESALKPSRRSAGPLAIHKVAEVSFHPLGVIGAIAPWNYPMHNMMNPVLAVLFAGSAVVVKPSEHTVYSSLHYFRILRRVLALCGHSPDLVQMVVGAGDVGKAMLKVGLDKLFFTGSTAIGKNVAVLAAVNLLPTVLELGGKDPFIVCEDADVRHAVDLCLRGVFQNSGQNCVGVERVFVHKKVKARFLEIAGENVAKVRSEQDVGAMTMGLAAVDNVHALVSQAVEAGAKVLHGGKQGCKESGGFYYEPTLLDGVTPEMRIAHEEVFGPVMALFEWEDEGELLATVNNCRFGLGASVFTSNKRRAKRLVDGLQVGMVNVNDFGINYLCQSMPFGGNKDSGSDRFAGIEGLRGCCLMKSTTRDRFPWIRTNIPRNFRYPVTNNAFGLAVHINEMVYMPGFWPKADALRNTLITLCTSDWMPRELKADIATYQ